jgi:ribosomal protein S18 acetylase RimI-like enzyme
MNPSLILRPEQPEDESFVYQLFAETRFADVAPLPLDREQKEAFLHQQFQLQTAHYQTFYPTAAFSIIQFELQRIGRLYVNRTNREIRVIDITLSPGYRCRGIGRGLLQDLLSEATTTGKAVRLHVERRNPALRLYARLGFCEIQDKGVYLEMEWRAPQKTTTR